MIEHPTILSVIDKKSRIFHIPEYCVEDKTSVVVIADTAAENLPPDQRELIFKILASVKVAEKDLVILHQPDQTERSVAFLKKKFGPEKMIVFSASVEALGKNLRLPLYTPALVDGVEIIRSAPLEKLMRSTEHKSVLWRNLKKMFGV